MNPDEEAKNFVVDPVHVRNGYIKVRRSRSGWKSIFSQTCWQDPDLPQRSDAGIPWVDPFLIWSLLQADQAEASLYNLLAHPMHNGQEDAGDAVIRVAI